MIEKILDRYYTKKVLEDLGKYMLLKYNVIQQVEYHKDRVTISYYNKKLKRSFAVIDMQYKEACRIFISEMVKLHECVEYEYDQKIKTFKEGI